VRLSRKPRRQQTTVNDHSVMFLFESGERGQAYKYFVRRHAGAHPRHALSPERIVSLAQ